ncbi:tRNA (adenosine(37)-N6)-dimethylallyltransferase MiaA [Raineyella sp. W15-4]|uniref:tRNA (adenosine(37)-N6)-dimethylallyltransferase MiaA n=1 Tax=Raineyella sp. W15-4 TaxID=3081651 RepID=UPI002955C73F|nr:tRNA (adenosine(37)-N6)-dimethylallyltransferase MiaA [Raineyella sp. W15-4]WOQ18476.1 tRNA (adenosine(37)-N6)-dimethylallyltransferase MiaA [Raineyella sp. W15-4]
MLAVPDLPAGPDLPVIAVIGPTASGKTALAIELVRRLGAAGRAAEIVNADSMLVYRGMDIGTAKPTAEERAAVRHHLVDIWDIDWTATVADFQRLARAAIADCRRRGVVPVLVGGSSLYIRAIVDEFEFPGTDPEVRSRLEAELAQLGVGALYARLRAADPTAAAGIEPNNERRVVRALEVIELTGHYTSTLPEHRYALTGVVQIGLSLEREVLDDRIAARVERMWVDGFVDEVRGLAERGLREGRTASRALGYRQVLDYLAGTIDEATAKETTITRTRRFARKQLGWFRRDDRILWVDATRPAAELAEALLAGPLHGLLSPVA